MNYKTLIITGLVLFVLLNAALMALYVYARPLATARTPVADLPVIKALPDFTLTSAQGTPFSPGDLAGQVWVADFIFTACPGPCPVMTRNLSGVAETLKAVPDASFVSISVDPENDTPEVLAAYGQRFNADPERWHFLTGEPEAIKAVAVEGFMVGSTDDVMIHSPKFCLVDQAGQIRGYYTGTDEADVDRMIADIHRLLQD